MTTKKSNQNKTSQNPLLIEALGYYKRGYSALPVEKDGSTTIAWDEFKEERVGVLQIGRWFSKETEDKNISIIVNKFYNTLVLEIGPEENVSEITEKYSIPKTPYYQIEGGSSFFFFKHPTDLDSLKVPSGIFNEKIEIHNDDLIPVPSIVTSPDNHFQWIHSIFDIPLADLPKELFKISQKHQDKKAESLIDELFEINQTIPLHPSLDVKNDILIFGFRVLDKERKSKNIYVIVNNGTSSLSIKSSLKTENQKYYVDAKNKVLEPLNERWGFDELRKAIKNNPDKPENAFKTIKNLFKKYTELTDESDYNLVIAWTIGTYFFRIFWSYPFLHPKAPKRSGKTQFLDLLTKICFNAKKARPTLAALGDTVDSLRGTFLIDQADYLSQKGKEDLLDILTDSYKREGGKRRIVDMSKKGARKVLEFETYSPKAFASIGELPEDLRDRCLIIPIMKSINNFPEPSEENENWNNVRGIYYQLLMSGYIEVEKIYEDLKKKYSKDSKMTGRTLDLWMPIETILTFLKLSESEIIMTKKRYCSLYGYTQYDPSDFEEKIVTTILEEFKENSEIILSPKEISLKIDPNINLKNEDERKKVASSIGWTIKKFNLSSEKIPRSKEGVRYRFEKEKIEKIYKSYFNHEDNLILPKEEPTLPTPEQKTLLIPEQTSGVGNLV